MREVRNHVFGENLRVVEHVLDRSRSSAWYILAKHGFPFPRAARLQRLVQLGQDFIDVPRALLDAVIALVRGEFIKPGLAAQRLPEMRRIGRDVEITVAGRMDAGDAA